MFIFLEQVVSVFIILNSTEDFGRHVFIRIVIKGDSFLKYHCNVGYFESYLYNVNFIYNYTICFCVKEALSVFK